MNDQLNIPPTPTGDEDEIESAESLERSTKQCSEIWIKHRVKKIAITAGVTVFMILILVVMVKWHVGAEFFVETHDVAQDIGHGATGGPAVMVEMLCTAVAFFGAVATLVQIPKLLLGPPKPGKSAEATVRSFFTNALVSTGMIVESSVDVVAYVCLLNRAKREIGEWTGFLAHWNNVIKSVADSLRTQSIEKISTRTFKIQKIRIENSGNDRANFEILFKVSAHCDSDNAGKKTSKKVGPSFYTAKGETIRVGNRWYLSSGRWNGTVSKG